MFAIFQNIGDSKHSEYSSPPYFSRSTDSTVCALAIWRPCQRRHLAHHANLLLGVFCLLSHLRGITSCRVKEVGIKKSPPLSECVQMPGTARSVTRPPFDLPNVLKAICILRQCNRKDGNTCASSGPSGECRVEGCGTQVRLQI
jgi:hypothetical protein